MTVKERKRLEVLSLVQTGELSLVKAAELLKLSYRQTKRIAARRRELGDTGLVHRLRGRASNRHVQPLRKEQAVELYRTKYAGYGPTLAAECLARDDELTVPVSTLRTWLSSAGLWQRQRQRKLHRRRRPGCPRARARRDPRRRPSTRNRPRNAAWSRCRFTGRVRRGRERFIGPIELHCPPPARAIADSNAIREHREQQ